MKKNFFYLIFLLFLLPGLAAAAEIAVISRDTPHEPVTTKTLERIYLKRKVLWDNGQKIVPVNLPTGNDLRRIFTEKILKLGHRELLEYWNEEYFKGRRPPLVLESEEAVKKFVRQVDGAVGYIRVENLEPDLKVIYIIKTE